MKINIFLTLALFISIFTYGCSNIDPFNKEQIMKDGNLIMTEEHDFMDINTSSFWNISINNAEIALALSATQSSLEYGGTIVEIPFEQLPNESYLYLLLYMTVEKINPGRSTFSWKDVQIIDAEGSIYTRHENDTFLTSLNLKRLKSTDITLGLNEGYVCFEIPITTVLNQLWFVYNNKEENIRIALNINNPY